MQLDEAIDQLAGEFAQIDFNGLTYSRGGHRVQRWLGKPEDDVMICLLRSHHTAEDYHKQDYFFFNYAYKGSYQALSQKYNNLIALREDECYFSQPECGYSINVSSTTDTIIIGVLIKKNTFFKEYLSVIATDSALFNFFLTPEKNSFAEEFIKLDFSSDMTVRRLLELMVVEYASHDDQEVLKSYTMSLLLLIMRKYAELSSTAAISQIDKIRRYISQNDANISLKAVARHFGYHPNYLSRLIHAKTGQKFSDLVLDSRMSKAKTMLAGTSLSIEDISTILGYSDTSNFYKAFKRAYGTTPRKW